MRSPDELYSIHRDELAADRPVLVYAFAGFVDAGAGVRIAADHMLASCDHHLVATFDVDEVFDYRARRPRMSYVVDHFASVEIPQISLHEVTDSSGMSFLLLVGPEPDYQWQRFIAAVEQLIDRYDVSMAIGLTAVPWPAPHTRPLGVTVHGSDAALLEGYTSVLGEIEVPGHVSAMLELQLGERGTPSMGITAQVPHYLVQFEYPNAASALLDSLAHVAGLTIPRDALVPAAERAAREITQQLEGNDEFAAVVAALEQQYDQMSQMQTGAGGGLADLAPAGGVPSGDEIAAMVEEFLQGIADEADEGKAGDS